MSVAIKPNLSNQIRTYAAANPVASPADIARRFGIKTPAVALALGRRPKDKAKSVAR